VSQRTSQRALRADAARNRDSILAAAVDRLNENPRASMAEIAEAAGVGRVTLYAHFPSREELLRQVLDRTMDRTEASFAAIELTAGPWAALDELVDSSWRLLADLTGVLAAVEQAMPTDLHAEHQRRPMTRVRELLHVGRSAGVFRDDQPVEWQSACYLAILHAAAAEVRAGRLRENAAAELVKQSIRALVRAD